MNFDKVAAAQWFDVVTPFAFGPPTFDPLMIATMVLAMNIVMIESTGMFLALSDMTGKTISRPELEAGLIMIVLGLLPKMAAFVGSIPQFALGGAGLVRFGMVAATGIRIPSTLDFKGNRHNLYIVALAIAAAKNSGVH